MCHMSISYIDPFSAFGFALPICWADLNSARYRIDPISTLDRQGMFLIVVSKAKFWPRR